MLNPISHIPVNVLTYTATVNVYLSSINLLIDLLFYQIVREIKNIP